MIKRFAASAIFLAGIGLAALLAVHAGIDSVYRALGDIGWKGIGGVCVLQFAALAVCGVAWWAVTEGVGMPPFLLSRWIRDGASNLVGFIPAIGEGISARALAVFGAAGAGAATASTIVDVAVEAFAEALYTLAAFILLWPHLPIAQHGRWLAIVAIGVVPILMMGAISLHKGAMGAAQRIGLRLAHLVGIEIRPHAFNLHDAIQTIYARRGRITAAFALHMAAWLLGAAQIWFAARAGGHPLSAGDSVALAGLVSAARSAFFLVPWAAGVQEGGFILVGSALGLDAASTIALSLVLRARDVIVGAPAILIWYVEEGRRRLGRRAHG
jgi:putative membrane protein